MDKFKEVYSKSIQNGGTTLLDHTKMVINVAVETAKRRIKDLSPKFLQDIAVAAALHDIGKCSASFQEYIKTQKESNFYRHNVLSWAFASSCVSKLSSKKHDSLRASVLYHHTVYEDPSLTSDKIISDMIRNDAEGFELMKGMYVESLKYIDEKFSLGVTENKDYQLLDIDDENDICRGPKVGDELLYPSKERVTVDGSVEVAYEYLINRAIITYADRIVSSSIYDNNRILNGDGNYIDTILKDRISCTYSSEPDYSEYDMKRLSGQFDISKEIREGSSGLWIVPASAGFGKTLTGIIYHFETRKKIKWCVPRRVNADSTYDSIISELKKMGMYDQVKVGLYYGGELQKSNFKSTTGENILEECDILVAVIDSFLGEYSKNSIATMLIDTCFSDVIFDEWHEFVCEEPLFAAFIYLVYSKKEHTNTKTILLSATEFDISTLIGGKDGVHILNPEIYGGEIKIEIETREVNDTSSLNYPVEENSFTIFPTVLAAQDFYINNSNGNAKLIHSRFVPEDRESHMNDIYSQYGKTAIGLSHKPPVIGTTIIGVGLDISSKLSVDFVPTPESLIQVGGGRTGRFKEYDTVKYVACKINNKPMRKFLGSLYPNELRDSWFEEVKKLNGETITKTELYTLRSKFNLKNSKKINRFLNECFGKSADALSEIKYKSGKKIPNMENRCIRGLTYRGVSGTFYATIENEDGSFMEPFVCDKMVLNYEYDDDISNKARFDFMVNKKNGFRFPSTDEFKYKYHIVRNPKKNTEMGATTNVCFDLARTQDRPLLLLNHTYDRTLGLRPIERR